MPIAIDHAAKEQVLKSWGVPECLHVPIGAVDIAAIEKHVGSIGRVLSTGSVPKALLVEVGEPPPIDVQYPIFDLEGAAILHAKYQVWVHIAYTRYRCAYRRAFPNETLGEKILSHAMNRRMAECLGFQYVRLTPTSRSANSSSAFSEKWGVELYRNPAELASHKKRGLSIRYADLSSLMLMLDIKLGGGVMDAVNEGQKLIQRRPV